MTEPHASDHARPPVRATSVPRRPLPWLQTVADQNVPAALGPAKVPMAWLGRSTVDNRDPTLSLPRQLDNSRHPLPDEFVIVAHFYDVESGRTLEELPGQAHAHEQFDIPIPRNGSIADLLEQPQRGAVRALAGLTVDEHELDRDVQRRGGLALTT